MISCFSSHAATSDNHDTTASIDGTGEYILSRNHIILVNTRNLRNDRFRTGSSNNDIRFFCLDQILCHLRIQLYRHP